MVDHTFVYTSAVRKIKEMITRGELGYMAAINIPLAIISIIGFGRVTRETIAMPPARFASLEANTALTEAELLLAGLKASLMLASAEKAELFQ